MPACGRAREARELARLIPPLGASTDLLPEATARRAAPPSLRPSLREASLDARALHAGLWWVAALARDATIAAAASGRSVLPGGASPA
jgi:hypothetical protein